MTKKFTMRLIKDLCFDASSSPVRAAVFRGLTYVLDNHLSHGLMREVDTGAKKGGETNVRIVMQMAG